MERKRTLTGFKKMCGEYNKRMSRHCAEGVKLLNAKNDVVQYAGRLVIEGGLLQGIHWTLTCETTWDRLRETTVHLSATRSQSGKVALQRLCEIVHSSPQAPVLMTAGRTTSEALVTLQVGTRLWLYCRDLEVLIRFVKEHGLRVCTQSVRDGLQGGHDDVDSIEREIDKIEKVRHVDSTRGKE